MTEPTPDVGEFWDQRFAAEPWPTDPDPCLVDTVTGLTPGRALDLGCGPGRHALWLAAHGWSAVGVDASAVGLRQAESAARAQRLTVGLVRADLERLPIREGCADLVVLANIHVTPAVLPRLLDTAARTLSPGGHLLVMGHDLANLGHHGPGDEERLFSVERLRAALPDLVIVERLERYERSPGPPADIAVLAWATRRP